MPVWYKGIELDAELRCDMLVEGALIVELKAMDALIQVHDAQVLTYMSLLNVPKGLLINFNCVNIFHQGQKTLVNEMYRSLT